MLHDEKVDVVYLIGLVEGLTEIFLPLAVDETMTLAKMSAIQDELLRKHSALRFDFQFVIVLFS